ncbi:PaaI family thioesterase [Oceanibacterium hippocampi]|nr:PaaI family thioesterase [Oceanibacterium hippocampi]
MINETAAQAVSYGTLQLNEIRDLPGLEVMRRVADGRFPSAPISKLMNFHLVEADDGIAIFEGTPGPEMLNPLGSVHGGWALTLVDSATGCAAHTTLEAGIGYTTVETKMNFARPISPETGLVRCEGRVISRGRKIITADAMLRDRNGKLLAHGTSTLIVLGPV